MFELEQKILAAAAASRQAYDDIAHAVPADTLTEVGKVILRNIGAYYSRDEQAFSVDTDLLAVMLSKALPSPKHCDELVSALRALPEHVSARNVAGICHDIKARETALRASRAMMAGSPDAEALAREFLAVLDAASGPETTQMGFDDIFSDDHQPKIAVYPKQLNTVLRGGMRPGSTAIVFGRPGAGKTLVTINLVCGMAYAGHKILYIGNEEPAKLLTLRFLSRLGSEALQNLDSADEEVSREAVRRALHDANQRGMKNVHIVHGVTALPAVRKWIERLKPDVLVLDQVRHISALGENLTASMEAVARAMRSFAAQYGLIVFGVTQASADAQGKAVLSLTDLDSSKTGLQGAVDLMVGVGHSEDRSTRYLSVCRNKVSGVIEAFPVAVDEQHTSVLNHA